MSISGGNFTKERFLHTLAVSLGNGVLCICIHAIENPLEPSVWLPWFVLGIGIVIGAVFRSFYTPGFIRTFGSVVLASAVWLLTNALLGKFWLSGLHPWLPLYWLSCWLGAGLALDSAGRPFFLTPVLISFMFMMACMAFIAQDGHPSSCLYAHVLLYTCAGMMMRRQEVPLWLGILIPGMEVVRGILAGLLTADHWWPLIHFLYPLVSLCGFLTGWWIWREPSWRNAGVVTTAVLLLCLSGPFLAKPWLHSQLWQEGAGSLPAHFHLEDTRGRSYTERSLKGKILYLDFWMTGCRPCLAGMPAVVRVAQEFAADTLICFMGISSAPYDNRTSFYAAKRFHETGLPQYYDSTGTLARAWNINGFPVGVLVDQAGRVRYTQSGFQRWEAGYLEQDLRAAIERLRAGG